MSQHPSKHIQWLLSELPQLKEQGVLGDTEAQSLIEHYQRQATLPSVSKHLSISNSWLFTVFAVFGAVLIGIGIISLIAFNWSAIPTMAKIFSSFVAVVLSQALCGFVLWKKSHSAAWREGAAILLMSTLTGALTIIDQAYHTGHEHLGDYVLLWLALYIPIMFLMRSTAAAVVIFMMAPLIVLDDNARHPLCYLGLMGLQASFIAWSIWINDKQKYTPSAYALLTMLYIFGGLLITLILEQDISGDSVEWLTIPAMIIYNIFFFILAELALSQSPYHPLKILSVGSMCGILYIWLIIGREYRIDNYISGDVLHDSVAFVSILIVLAMLASSITAFVTVPRLLKQSGHILSIIAFALLLLWAGIEQPYYHGRHNVGKILHLDLVASMVFVFLSLWWLVIGFRQRRLPTMLLGSSLFAIFILTKFLTIDTSLIAKGIGSIVIGIVFLLANYLMKRQLDKQAQTQLQETTTA